MEENREQILSDFQSCTGIEDVGESIMHLEACQWNLLDAINSVMPEESQTLPSEREAELPMEVIEASISSAAGDQEREIIRSTEVLPSMPVIMDDGHDSHLAARLLNFVVQYKESVLPLEVPDSETVAAIKAALHAELGVPPCRQELCGWRQNHITDDTILSSLQLPQRTELFLIAPDHVNITPNSTDMSSFGDRLDAKYKLHIIDTTNNKEYDLQFPGSKTVLEVKSGLRDITNIPVRFQHWVGWPDSVKDDSTKLASLDIPNQALELILSREETLKPKKPVPDLSDSENEFEDAAECFGIDDDAFQSTSASKKIMPLMPEDVEDEASAVLNFEMEFSNRYGPFHPSFQGTLTETLQASCHKPAKERKPLAIYLHHDASVLTNVFCTELLCSETVVTYLAQNFVTWAWDLTFESNKTFLLAVLSQNLGMAAASTVRTIALNSLPALMVITKVRSTPEVLTVIPGNVGLDDLMTRLIHAVEVFNSEMQSEIWEEEEREARENVKREQDQAYEESLLADRAKEEARRQEFEVKQKQVEEEQLKKEEQEQMRQQEEAIKDAVRKSLADQLPDEPSSDAGFPISHIRVRLPTGVTIARRFRANTPLSVLLNYIASQGYPTAEFKVLASWPRRDLVTLEPHKTLEELKLYPKETLTLEER